jgi:ABC-type phosphate transport system substrate-binding protein
VKSARNTTTILGIAREARERSAMKKINSGRVRSVLALTVGAGVIGSFALTGPALAAVPAAGVNCTASDGKLNGRGATFQTIAQNTFAAGFRDDVCGATPGAPAADAAGDAMVIYNYPSAVAGSFTGSGQGLRAAGCRSDAFAGTDLPYSETQLGQLNGPPGPALGTCPGAALAPPFAPSSAPWPDPADQAAPVMSFPVAGSSVQLGVNLSAADCGGTRPASLSFTSTVVNRLLGGDILNWNDPALRAGGVNAGLASCNIAITRVVRQDNSGTTGVLKNYLGRVDNARASATSCAVTTGAGGDPTKTWASYNGTPNTKWPGDGSSATDGTCSPVVNGGSSGAPSLITKLTATAGGVGYADAPDIQGKGFLLANIRNATDTAYVSGVSGKSANCDFSFLLRPGSTPADNVGLKATENWGNDNNAVNGTGDHVNATQTGPKYPICGLTFALVYTGLGNGSVANANGRLTPNQRRTLYSYFTYILSNTAQDRLGQVFYAGLPSSWLGSLRSGFQANV